jgi:nucleoid DNA-binding protein
MTKAELIDRIARSRELPPDVTKKCIAQVLDLAFAELADYFIRAKIKRSSNPRFTFPGFGTFAKKKRSARKGVHPRTLEPIHIDACFTLDFRPSAELRETMNAKGDAKQGGRSRGKAEAPASRRRNAARVEVEETSWRKRLTPRDERAELEAMGGDDARLFDEPILPESPMQRTHAVAEQTTRTGTR